MIRLENVLTMYCRHLCNTSWRRFEIAFKTSWQDVFAKNYWKCVEDVLKTSWSCIKDVWPRQIFSSWSRRQEDVFRRHMSKTNTCVLIKMSSRRTEDVLRRRRQKTSSRHLEDDFINRGKYNKGKRTILERIPYFTSLIS